MASTEDVLCHPARGSFSTDKNFPAAHLSPPFFFGVYPSDLLLMSDPLTRAPLRILPADVTALLSIRIPPSLGVLLLLLSISFAEFEMVPSCWHTRTQNEELRDRDWCSLTGRCVGLMPFSFRRLKIFPKRMRLPSCLAAFLTFRPRNCKSLRSPRTLVGSEKNLCAFFSPSDSLSSGFFSHYLFPAYGCFCSDPF